MFPALSRIGRRRALQASAAALVVFGLLRGGCCPSGESAPKREADVQHGRAERGLPAVRRSCCEEALAKDMPECADTSCAPARARSRTSRGVATGEADFTIATADAVAKYRRDGKPGADRLRGCARLYDDYVQLVVPALGSR